MIVEEARPSDAEGIHALEAHFPERERWSQAAWEAELKASDRLVLVGRLRESGDVVGAATFQLVGDAADLHRIVVTPEHRRRGMARVMLDTGLHWAAHAGAQRMLLEVRTDNADALHLYRDLGFEPVTVRRDYYGTGVDAQVCQRDLRDLDSFSPWAREETR